MLSPLRVNGALAIPMHERLLVLPVAAFAFQSGCSGIGQVSVSSAPIGGRSYAAEPSLECRRSAKCGSYWRKADVSGDRRFPLSLRKLLA